MTEHLRLVDENFDFDRESVDNTAPPPEMCPACGEELDKRWPMKLELAGFDPDKEWVRCSNCGAWVEQI